MRSSSMTKAGPESSSMPFDTSEFSGSLRQESRSNYKKVKPESTTFSSGLKTVRLRHEPGVWTNDPNPASLVLESAEEKQLLQSTRRAPALLFVQNNHIHSSLPSD